MKPERSLPLVEELIPAPDVMSAVKAVCHLPQVLLLDSALQREPVGRYSFLMADPVDSWQIDEAHFGRDPFQNLKPSIEGLACESVPGLPPFQGGIAGLLGYELGGCFERVQTAKCNEFKLPVMSAGLYDWVIAWDHQVGRAWLMSHGWLATDETSRHERAVSRMTFVLELLRKTQFTSNVRDSKPNHIFRNDGVSPQFEVEGLDRITSNFSRDDYLAAVASVIEYIRAGDIFQANLTQRLMTPATESPVDLFERLRKVNPAPFAGLMLCDDWAVISASPERFLRVDGCEVETRPIKGTRKRKRGPEADLFTRDELRESEKDQAENVMIVDLLRNDLSRISEAGSIRVPQLCGVETYETVQHLVSEVRGRLREDADIWDLFRVALPGGSISGAPKVRAMEIIAELEPTVRGPYCGSLFYVGANGQADCNLLIRTFVQRHGWLQLGVGGGIVAQSDPVSEYEETLTKAAGMLRALPMPKS